MYTMEDAVKDHAKIVAEKGASTMTIMDITGTPYDYEFNALANLYGTALIIINKLQKELDERKS